MGTQEFSSGPVAPSWHPSSIVYSRSYLSACLRAGAIALMLLAILLAVVAAITMSGDPPKSNTTGATSPVQQDEPVQRGLKTE